MLFFILMIFFKENQINNEEDLINKIRQILGDLFGCISESTESNISIDQLLNEHLLSNAEEDILNSCIDNFITNLFTLIVSTDFSNSLNYIGKIEILKHLQTAKQGSSGSLFNYLRGCEYGGAPHLQTKTSIYLACYYIVHKYAIPDNIRYLTLRCAVDGYKKFGLFKSNEEAMEALLQGLAHAVKKANDNKYGKKIHVDVILTAKRHKSIEQFSQNVDVALKYRNGLLEEGQAKRFVKENLQEGFDNINSEWDLKKSINEKIDGYISTINDSNNHTTLSFFDTQPKVVSFDLAGLEKGNRAGKYYDQFLPLLKKCFPITIHAGEEDTYEGIWEAIYVVQSQRIGHALTLRNNKELLDIVKDRHIAIELCPLSNILTRDKSWEEAFPVNQRNDPEEYVKEECYPLRQYLMENIDVTINTDNPFISDTTLTDEFMVAAKMAGGLTKWEILRLIKNSFRSAALPKEQKKRLMDEIDDEIYSLLLDER
jgi:adenosine deaminase